MADLRVALTGCGFISDLHARAVAQVAGARVVAVSNHRLESAQAFATRHGIARATTDWETQVTAADIDVVVVGTPNHLHAPQALTALRAGKAVLVDKPMALTLAAAEEMAQVARETGSLLVVGHMWRYRDEVRALRDRIAAGVVGRVVRTHGYGVHAQWGPSGWFTQRALAGGGALIDMGVHAIDTARFLLGDPDPVRVVASLGTAFGDYDVDDDGVILIDWSSGVRSTIDFGWWEPHLAGLEADTEVYGTAGYERIWPTTPMPEGYEHCSLPMYASQMADFLGRARSRDHVSPSGAATMEAGLVAMRIVDAAYASAREVSG